MKVKHTEGPVGQPATIAFTVLLLHGIKPKEIDFGLALFIKMVREGALMFMRY